MRNGLAAPVFEPGDWFGYMNMRRSGAAPERLLDHFRHMIERGQARPTGQTRPDQLKEAAGFLADPR